MTASTSYILARTIHRGRRVACVVLLAGLAGLPACQSPLESHRAPREPVLQSFYADFSTSESDARLGSVLLVGEVGHASWLAYTSECLWDAPCLAGVTADLRSSDSSVVAPALERGTDALPFVGKAPGQAYLRLSAQGFRDSTLVTVVREPLPIDDIYIGSGFPVDSVVERLQDSTGNLVGVVLPVRGYAAVYAQGRRAGYQVWMATWSIESSDSAVVAGMRYCRPAIVDPQCGIASPGWITGLARGRATVTFTMRNVRRQVAVVVQ